MQQCRHWLKTTLVMEDNFSKGKKKALAVDQNFSYNEKE